MSNWNGKLKCIKDYNLFDTTLTKGKVYEVKNGHYKYDNGYISGKYSNYANLVDGNPDFKYILVEELDWHIEQSKLAKYIMINETVTIAIPPDTPIAFSFRHPEDEYCEEIGQALALKRLYEQE